MREILFRGKSLITHEWIYGDLFQHGEQRFIMAEGKNTEVEPETVGEFTGHIDKNGVKIFEGDIINYESPGYSVKYGTINFGKYALHTDCPAYNIGFYISWLNNPFVRQDLGFWLEQREIVIIGNIYDNPELLGTSEYADNPTEQPLLAPAT